MVDELYRQGKPHYAAIAGTLADKPEIASWILSLLPALPYKSRYTPSDTSSVACSDVSGAVTGVGSTATPAKREAWKHRRILPRRTPVRCPSTPPTVCAERSSPGGKPHEDQRKPASKSNNADEEPETERRRRAKVIAASVLNELSPENKTSLFDFRKEAAAIRSDTMEAQLQSSGTGSRSANPAQAEVIDGITTLRRNLRGKKIVQRLAVFRKKVRPLAHCRNLAGTLQCTAKRRYARPDTAAYSNRQSSPRRAGFAYVRQASSNQVERRITEEQVLASVSGRVWACHLANFVASAYGREVG